MNTIIKNTLTLLEQASAQLMSEIKEVNDLNEGQDILFTNIEIRKAINAITEKFAQDTIVNKKGGVKIYTDGACSGNPGPGGYGVIIEFPDGTEELIAEGFALTTNNRMELRAVIAGIMRAQERGFDVEEITSDSSYVINAVTRGWLHSWRRENYTGRQNADLWKELDKLIQGKSIKFQWIKGHAGHAQNERCDKLAVKAYGNRYLKTDNGYKK